jgi:hypothetical protein
MNDVKPLNGLLPLKVVKMEDCGEHARVTVEDSNGVLLTIDISIPTARKLSIGGQVAMSFMFPEAALADWVVEHMNSPTSRRAKIHLLNAEGGCLTRDELLERFGSHSDVYEHMLRSRCVIGIDDGDGVVKYPVWQFAPNGTVIDGIPLVLRQLPSDDPWGAMIFFLEPNERLGTSARTSGYMTPIQALRDERIQDVLAAAQAWGVH